MLKTSGAVERLDSKRRGPTVEWCVQTSRLPIEGGSVRSVVGIPYGSEGGLSCEDNYLRDGGIGWESSQSAAKLRRMGSPRKLGAGFPFSKDGKGKPEGKKTQREHYSHICFAATGHALYLCVLCG
jgi:hypothetical protein